MIREKAHKRCVEAVDSKRVLIMVTCDEQKMQQKWDFSFVNTELIHEKYPSL